MVKLLRVSVAAAPHSVADQLGGAMLAEVVVPTEPCLPGNAYPDMVL